MVEENIKELSPEKPQEQNQEATPLKTEISEVDLLKVKIAELENIVNQLKDQLLRKAAEFDNYKKRVENDYAAIIKFSNENMILKLLPVLDDFERSMKMSKNSTSEVQAEPSQTQTADENSFALGIELIYNKLKKILELEGVKTFDTIGKPFDTEYHDALLQIPKPDVPPHTVVEEIEKGYMLNDKVIRHAKVIVSSDEHVIEETKKDEASPGIDKTDKMRKK